MTINQYLQKDIVLWIDTETSGVYSGCDICQVAGMFEQEGRIIHSFNMYSHPFHDTVITPEAIEVMGVSEKTLWTYPSPKETYQELISVFQTYLCGSRNHIVAGHSVSFDLKKLLQYGRKVFYGCFRENSLHDFIPLDEYLSFHESFCTYVFAKRLRKKQQLPKRVGSNSLRSLAQELGLPSYRAHNAREDVQMVRKLAYKLLARRD